MATIETAIRLNDMMSDPIHDITRSMNRMLSTWEDLDQSTSDGLEINGINNARDNMDGLTDSIMGAVGAYISLQSLGQLVNLSDNLTQTQARLNMINDGAQTTDELFDKIAASADRSRASISATADTVAKLSLNAGDAFSSNDETILFAENLNKLFAVAGTEAASVESATLQLTQALGSGVLRGEEFNAVFEAAPNIMRTVADYMDVPIGQLRSMAQEGQITAEVVKNALLSATDDINTQFESMPMTWAQVWTGITNELYYASVPLLEFINLLANNWSVLEPIVLGVATAVGLYTAALLIYKGVAAGTALMESVRAAATMMSTGATFAATAAQHGFNAALLACPITWIVVAIIAIIAAIYMAIAAINKLQGTTISATGVIMGVLAVAGAFILNLAIGVLNAIIQAVWTIFVEPFIGIIEWVLNAANGGFNSFGGAVANLIGQIIGWFLSLGKVVTKIIDAIFGTNWTSGLEALRGEVISWGKNEDAITMDIGDAPTIDRIEYGDAWNAGYDFGAGVEESVGGFFNGGFDGLGDKYSMDNLMSGIGDIPAIGDIASNTGDIKDSLDITHEDLKYLRDIAEQDVVNRFTTAEIRVDLGGVTNNVNQNTDLDGVMDYFVSATQEAMERVAEGVHN